MPARLDMIGLVCKDMAASFRFYSLFGLKTSKLDAAEPYQEVMLDSGIRLSFNNVEMVKGIDPDWKPPVGQGIGIAFLCDSPAEVDQLHERVVDAGFRSHKAPWDAFWGQRYAIVLDPDGYAIDLFAPL